MIHDWNVTVLISVLNTFQDTLQMSTVKRFAGLYTLLFCFFVFVSTAKRELLHVIVISPAQRDTLLVRPFQENSF